MWATKFNYYTLEHALAIFYLNISKITLVFFFFIFTVTSLLKYKNVHLFLRTSNQYLAKLLVMKFIATNLFLLIIKFLFTLLFVQTWLWNGFLFKFIFTDKLTEANLLFTNVYNNPLGDGLLLLCYITSLACIWYLGDRGVFEEHSSTLYFTFFLMCTTIMTTTSNLLVMFISFEFIFLPSLYFVYLFSYSKKADKTIWFLLLWTLLGAFLVLYGFSLVYGITHTLDYKVLFMSNFKHQEQHFIYLLFFVGFGVKIPIFPFHYWLTKVHVEAPAGFSMFLSGFLVKTALYCFYFVNLIFNNYFMHIIFLVWTSVCIAEASIKMWTQTDIKKLIAFATIQEMNMLLICLLLSQTINMHIVVIFLLLHGILSTMMFFLVDQVQKRTQTRNILKLSGAMYDYPILKAYIWVMLLQFLGIPLTSKFIIEWYVGSLLFGTLGIYGAFIFFIALFFGGIGFFRCWASIMYGTPTIKYNLTSDLSSEDIILLTYLALSLVFLNFLIFLI